MSAGNTGDGQLGSLPETQLAEVGVLLDEGDPHDDEEEADGGADEDDRSQAVQRADDPLQKEKRKARSKGQGCGASLLQVLCSSSMATLDGDPYQTQTGSDERCGDRSILQVALLAVYEDP